MDLSLVNQIFIFESWQSWILLPQGGRIKQVIASIDYEDHLSYVSVKFPQSTDILQGQ